MQRIFPSTIILFFLVACSSTQKLSTAIPTAPEPPEVSTALQISPSPDNSQVGTTSPTLIFPSPELRNSTQTPALSKTLTSPTVSTFPDPALFTWTEVYQGLQSPVGITNAFDGSGRIFIIEQEGTIRVAENFSLLPEYFLDIRDRVGSSGSEQGLLGLAFHPDFPQDDRLFVNYTNFSGNTVVSSFNLLTGSQSMADPGSEEVLISIDQPYRNHNGGQLAFGPDGYLYIGTGDGGSAGDPLGNSQSLNTLLGKILRIDINSPAVYGIPPDNPYQNGEGLPEIWAFGLRNPWRFSFDKMTGDLYIGDVGQNLWEEIDFLPAGNPGGANFGWNYFEGSHYFQQAPSSEITTIPPVFEYGRESGCSVTGGFVYRGSVLTEFSGVYLFGDYCSGSVWGLIRTPIGQYTGEILFQNVGRITSFGEDETGELYLVDHSGVILSLKRK